MLQKKQTPGSGAYGGRFDGQLTTCPPNTVQILEKTFTLCFFPSQLTLTANRFCLLARFFLGGLLEMLLKLHLTEDTFTLKFFLQRTKRLIDVVITNRNLHVVVTTFLS